MANEPGPAREKRSKPGPRRNGQGDQEGSPHKPEEFLRGKRALPEDAVKKPSAEPTSK